MEAGVAVLADIHFGRRVPGDGQHIRFSYAASHAAINDGVQRLDAFVAPAHVALPMPTSLANNQAARDAVLARVRSALGKSGPHGGARRSRGLRRRACARPASGDAGGSRGALHRGAPRTCRAASNGSPTARAFRRPSRATCRRARFAAGARLAASRARASAGPNSPTSIGQAAGLAIEARPTTGDDRLGITGTFCAIAETGTLVVLAGADTPTATTLLPDTHVAVVRADRIVSGHGRGLRARPARTGPPAARGEPHFRPVAHRRYRADDRARRARSVSRAHPRARLGSASHSQTAATTASSGSMTIAA